MSLRVLHVLDHSIPLHSGYSFRTRAIIEAQRALGWSTTQLTSSKHYATAMAEEEVDGLHFYRSPPLPGWQSGIPMLNHWAVVRLLEQRLDEIVARERPDLLHAHSPALNGLAALRVARRRGLPLVYEVRAFWEDAAVDHGTISEGGPRYRLTRSLETYVLRRADAITCICEGLRGDILARGIAPGRVTVIPNAVDPARFHYEPPRDRDLAVELGLSECVVLGFIGSFYAYEGLDLALRALPLVRERFAQARFLLVGGGPQEKRLRALVEELGLGDAVRFTGRVPHEMVSRYYALVDAFVYPRRSIRLTELVTPLKPLEAMAQGKLVVASDVGGHRELIQDGETGFLFPPDSPEDIAAGVIRCLEAVERWPTLRKTARHFVERERSWSAVIRRYQDVYGKVLDATPASTGEQGPEHEQADGH